MPGITGKGQSMNHAALTVIWILTFQIHHGHTTVFLGAPHMAKADCEAAIKRANDQDFAGSFAPMAGRVLSCIPIYDSGVHK